MSMQLSPFLWFDTQAEEAARFYTDVFEDGRILTVTHYTEGGPGPAGQVMTVDFELSGQRVVALNGGPKFQFTEAVSMLVTCDSQDEVDRLWDRLTEGGEEGPCGWLKDRFGLSWQVVPKGLSELFAEGDPERSGRAMQAMRQMKKLDIHALRSAAGGVAAA